MSAPLIAANTIRETLVLRTHDADYSSLSRHGAEQQTMLSQQRQCHRRSDVKPAAWLEQQRSTAMIISSQEEH